MAEESDPSAWRRALPAQIAAHRASGEILVMDVDVEDRRVADDLLRQRALHVRAAAAVAVGRRVQGGDHRTRIGRRAVDVRSEEPTSELQSLMRISYAVFCLNK